MRMHVMENLRQRIEAGHGDYINELRVCTTVFCGIPSLQVWVYRLATCFWSTEQGCISSECVIIKANNSEERGLAVCG
jgi:hypothetical protein